MSYKFHLDHNRDIDYATVKKKVTKHEPLIVSMPLNKIDFGMEKTIKIDGHIMPTTERAYDTLLKGILGVSDKFAANFQKAATQKQQKEFLSILKSGIASKNGENVNVVCDPVKRIVHGFYDGSVPVFTNERMLYFFEMIMERFPEFKLKDFYMDEGGNRMTLNVRSGEVSAFMTDEEFSGGLSFTNDPYSSTGGSVMNTILRLICSNGMTRYSPDGNNLLKGSDTKSVTKMFEKLDAMKQSKFLGPNFEDTLKKATYLPASVAELNHASRVLRLNSDADRTMIGTYMHHSEVRKFLAKKGIEMSKLTSGQAVNCPTNLPMWDVINLMTHFGSHDYGLTVNRTRVQFEAGNLFGKRQYDAANFIHLN